MNVFRCVQCQCHSATGKAKDWGRSYLFKKQELVNWGQRSFHSKHWRDPHSLARRASVSYTVSPPSLYVTVVLVVRPSLCWKLLKAARFRCHSAIGAVFFLSFLEKLLGAFYSDSIFLFTLFLDAGYIRQDLPNAVCFVQTKPDGDLLKDYLELVESRRPPLGVLHQCHCLNQKKKQSRFPFDDYRFD